MAGAIINPYAVLPGGSGYAYEVLQDNPKTLWMMDETSGTVATDQGSVGEDGDYGTYNNPTLASGTVFGLTVPVFTSSQTMTVPYNAGYWGMIGYSGAITFEYIWNPNSASNWSKLLDWPLMNLNNLDNTMSWFFASNGSSGSVVNIQVNNIFSTGTDYHVVHTYQYNTISETWINGVSYGKGVPAGVIPSYSAASLKIGRTDGLGTRGAVGGVAIYGHVLSDARIADHYAALVAGP